MEPSALSVHANIYTPKDEFEANGDDRLRSNFHQRMREMLKVGQTASSNIVDAGHTAEEYNRCKFVVRKKPEIVREDRKGMKHTGGFFFAKLA